jgi:Holliday junction resolvase RusA-like endonuclease
MDQVEFWLDHVPVPASRPRVSRNGGVFYPKAHATYHQWLMTSLRDVLALKASDVVEVKFLFVMPAYKTSDSPTHRSDLDNLVKLPMDCMTQSKDGDEGRFWADDHMVVGLLAFKRFALPGEEPHTRVKVSVLLETPEAYAERMFND